MTDVVYAVRKGNGNEELRHSLRSLDNLAHSRVWIFGHKPRWVQNVTHVAVRQGPRKHFNTWAIWEAMAAIEDLSSFTLMDDDVYLLSPIARAPAWHAGPLNDWMGELARRAPGNPTLDRMQRTRRFLLEMGRVGLLSYELHYPMRLDRHALAEAMMFAQVWRGYRGFDGDPLCKRTLYGNMAQFGGTLADDVKIRGNEEVPDENAWVCSTQDASFAHGRIGRWLRERFPKPSRYEKD